MRSRLALVGLLLVSLLSCQAKEGVVLLHGLARTEKSMRDMATVLQDAGYLVLNVDYPSRTATVETLADSLISQALANPIFMGAERIHFVTHSLGGILVRSYLARNEVRNLGRVVMLGPPNQGSEVVDLLGDLKLFTAINGPAGSELGTAASALPHRLGPVNFELGVIAGDRSINWINSLMIDGPDDGKVSVARTRIDGMKDHVVLHATHPYLMKNKQAVAQTLHFLREGKFLPL